MRQEMVRKQLEAKEQKQKEEDAKREEEQRKKLLEQEAHRLFDPKPTLTPLIAPNVLAPHRFGPRSFMPVSNALAIQKAKEKVMQMKMDKMKEQPSFTQTIAQTSSKVAGRVAHMPAPAVEVNHR